MFQFLGEVERLVSDLYPYRVPLTIGALAVLVAAFAGAWRAGWVHAAARTVRRYPLPSAAAALLVLAVTLPVAWYLASPLWTRVELNEASPLAAAPTADPTEAPPSLVATPPATPRAERTPPAREPTATATPFVAREVSRGMWMGADAFHFAEGDALIIEVAPGQYVLRVENFSIRNGPDLYMMLSPDPDGYTDAALNLGSLRATDGAFNYDIPPGTDLSTYQSVVVWCEDFAVLFATARLEMI